MLKDITIGQYYPTDSIIHKLDPRTKMIGILVFIVTIFLADTFIQYGAIILLTALVIWLSKVPFKFMIKGLKPVLFILIFAFIMNAFFTPGEELFRLGFILAIKMMLRLSLLIVGTSLLTLTSSPIRLTDALESLFGPLKKIGFPAHELAMMMTIALRFIPTLLEETDKIMKAQKARGADFESGNILKRAKSLIPLLVPLFIAAFKRADELAYAMEARGYRGGDGRTKLHPLKYEKRDLIAFLLLILFVAGILFIGRF